jgi:hypothetical protein
MKAARNLYRRRYYFAVKGLLALLCDTRARSVPFTTLCRLYDNAVRSASNSYAIESTFGATKRLWKTSMSVTPVDEPPGIWRSLAQALDAYFVDRTKRAVPEIRLRRAKQEVARCRMLVHKLHKTSTVQSKQA